jgi:hypothetical protein
MSVYVLKNKTMRVKEKPLPERRGCRKLSELVSYSCLSYLPEILPLDLAPYLIGDRLPRLHRASPSASLYKRLRYEV